MATERATDRPDDRDQAKPAGHDGDDLAAENRRLRRKVAQLHGDIALLTEAVRRSGATRTK